MPHRLSRSGASARGLILGRFLGRLLSPGMWYILASTVFLSLSGVCIKFAGEQASVVQIVTVRSFFGLILCMISAGGNVRSLLGFNRRLLCLRGVLGMLAMLTTFTAFTILPVAEATVIYFVNPVFVVVLAWIFLSERLGTKGWVSVGICFFGVLLVARPSFLFGGETALSSFGVLTALAGALFAAGSMVVIRALGPKERTLSMIFYLNAFAFCGAVGFAVFDWTWGNAELWGILAAVGMLTQTGQYFMTKGLSLETAGRGSAVGYFQIVFAIIWSIVFFSDYPDLGALLGAGLIMGGTLGVRERPKGTPNP